jgi:hypothetical protein
LHSPVSGAEQYTASGKRREARGELIDNHTDLLQLEYQCSRVTILPLSCFLKSEFPITALPQVTKPITDQMQPGNAPQTAKRPPPCSFPAAKNFKRVIHKHVLGYRALSRGFTAHFELHRMIR